MRMISLEHRMGFDYFKPILFELKGPTPKGIMCQWEGAVINKATYIYRKTRGYKLAAACMLPFKMTVSP
jgi:hypothetical protein